MLRQRGDTIGIRGRNWQGIDRAGRLVCLTVYRSDAEVVVWRRGA